MKDLAITLLFSNICVRQKQFYNLITNLAIDLPLFIILVWKKGIWKRSGDQGELSRAGSFKILFFYNPNLPTCIYKGKLT